jgi:hypothetical protein
MTVFAAGAAEMLKDLVVVIDLALSITCTLPVKKRHKLIRRPELLGRSSRLN